MKYLSVLAVLIFSILGLSAQSLFHFLDNQKGVKSIETTLTTGKKDAPKTKIEETHYYNKEGKLEKWVKNGSMTFEYLYLGDTVIGYVQYKGDDCKTATEYLLSREGNSLTIKSKNHEGKWKPENACEQVASERDLYGADATHLFKEVKRTIPMETYYSSLWIIEYVDEKDPQEYDLYYYSGSKRYKRYSLFSIEQVRQDESGDYFKSRFGVEHYGTKRIVLQDQNMIDTYGFRLKYFSDKEIYTSTGEKYGKYSYKTGKKKRWTKQSLIKPDAENILERERQIKYY